MIAHTCEDGHAWVEQEDGGVSPSWGMAGTSHHYPGWDPRACPEPERDEEGRYECPGCGGRFYGGHGTPGVMSAPWDFQEGCRPPEPGACGKPPVRSMRWVEGNRKRGAARTHGGWEEILTDPLTNATGEGMIASAGNPDEPQEVPMTEKTQTEKWHVIDRRDGERVAGGFGTCEEAEAWIEKTDKRGSDDFEARETTTGQSVVVCGPNLSSAAQRKGDMHVHAAGCGDLKHYGPGRKFAGDVNGEHEYKLTVSSLTEIAQHCYADHIAESDDTAADYLSSFHFAPCVTLPETAPETEGELARAVVAAETVEERVEAARKLLDIDKPKTPGVFTLIAKPEAKTWHVKAAGTDLALCGIVVSAARGAGNAQIEEGVDDRALRHANRPVCGNCRDQFTNRTTTTEEVTMSTAAASASTEAKPDPKIKSTAAAGQSRSRTSTRSTAASTRAAAAPAKTTDAPEIPEGLEKTLISQVKAMKPKPELKAPPSGSYTIIKSGGTKIGGFRPQSRKGVCVMFAVSPSVVKATVKGATVEAFEKNVYKSRAFITNEAQAAQAVKVLAETAKKAAAAEWPEPRHEQHDPRAPETGLSA